ncbi:nuclear transport factor 2 family protein [bacterium]|nr:nuclear transport factor 2 family protein [bacterium]
MTIIEQNEAAARRCIDLFNKRTLEWVETCYAPDVEWIELPLPATPGGQHGNRAFFGQVARRILSLFPDRHMEIRNLVAQSDRVVLELDWRGTAAASVGNIRAGMPIRFRVASFLTFAGGMIIKQVDYCVLIPTNEA